MKDRVDPHRFTGKTFTRRKTFPASVDDFAIRIDGLAAGRIQKSFLGMASLDVKTAGEGHLAWSGRMTARGLDFLEDWIAKNVTAADHAGGHQRAIALAQKCVNDAVGMGIPLEELETDERLSVTGVIFDAMVHLAQP